MTSHDVALSEVTFLDDGRNGRKQVGYSVASYRSDKVYVKSRESQKNYKNNKVIMITSVRACVCVCASSNNNNNSKDDNEIKKIKLLV